MISIGLGTAQFDPESPISIDELLFKADALMYVHKRRDGGVNRSENLSEKPETIIILRFPVKRR